MKKLHFGWWILVTCIIVTIIIIDSIPHTFGDTNLDQDDESQQHQRQLKTLLEPCETVYIQVHCDDDDDDYMESEDDECTPIKTDDCDRSLQLYCHTGLCLPNCHPTLEDYDQVRGKCFRKIGANCTKSEECDVHATCDRQRHCRCAKNYTLELETGKCQRSAEFGEFCDSEVICDMIGDVVCNNSTCQCRDPEAQYFHSKRKRCYLRVGEDCRNKLGSFQFCPDNSDCIRILESGEIEQYIGIPAGDDWGEQGTTNNNFSCHCKNGFAPTRDGKACQGIYGTPCNSLHKCNSEGSFKCYNTGVRQECRCARPKDQIFSEKLQKCVTLLGSLCDENKGNGSSNGKRKRGDTSSSCVIRATCQQDVADTRGVHTCECLPGFSVGSLENDICLKDHGQNCSTAIMASTTSPELVEDGEENENIMMRITMNNDDDELFLTPCNGFIGLECSNYTGTCQCQDSNQFYDVKLKKCRDFEVAQRRIPVTHYDTSDREYLFHYNEYNNNNAPAKKEMELIHCFIILILCLFL